MAIEIRHSGQTVTVSSHRTLVTAKVPSYIVSVVSGSDIGGIPYLGTYEITPTTAEQILATQAKTMANDLTIHSIPYHSTSNDSGGLTVSIAS